MASSPVVLLMFAMIWFYKVIERVVLPAVGPERMPRTFMDEGEFDRSTRVYWQNRSRP